MSGGRAAHFTTVQAFGFWCVVVGLRLLLLSCFFLRVVIGLSLLPLSQFFLFFARGDRLAYFASAVVFGFLRVWRSACGFY